MNNQLTLETIFSNISKGKFPFLYYGVNQKVFTSLAAVIQPYLLDMAHDKIQGQFLLSKTMLMPMVDTWQVRFHDGFAQNDLIICNQRLYRLHLSTNEQLVIEEDEEQFITEQQQFFIEWHAVEQNLAEFGQLKTNHPILSPADYHSSEWHISPQLLAEIREKNLPVFVLNLQQVENNYQSFINLLPEYKVYYSIKTNPNHEVLQLLYRLGSFFEAVSYAEIDLAFQAGATAEQLLFSAPVKRVQDIEKAHDAGVRLFMADCIMEIDKLAKYAPNSCLILRIKSSDNGAQVKLSSKYGLDSDDVVNLFIYAQKQGLKPYGITFHVGGQNSLVDSWAIMQQKAHDLFAQSKAQSIDLQVLNIGGGFPIQLDANSPHLEEISATLVGTQQSGIDYCAEPGRIIVGNAAKLVCPVVTVAERKDGTWLYIDASIFGSLFMMGFHAFEYRITTDHCHLDVQSYHIASLSCDGRDIIARNVLLPKGIEQNNLLSIDLVGAYSLPIFNVAYAGVSKTEIHYIK